MSEYYQDVHRYDDILQRPYQPSKEREHMSLHDRAAQFAPFAALTGYEEAILETARLTEERVNLGEEEIAEINKRLFYIATHLKEKIPVAITYFKPDEKKSGGVYLTDVGSVKKIDTLRGEVEMEKGVKISMENIVSIVQNRQL